MLLRMMFISKGCTMWWNSGGPCTSRLVEVFSTSSACAALVGVRNHAVSAEKAAERTDSSVLKASRENSATSGWASSAVRLLGGQPQQSSRKKKTESSREESSPNTFLRAWRT